MTRLAYSFLLLALFWLPSPGATAQTFAGIHSDTVRVCPGDGTQARPDFNAPDCETMSFWEIDPQDREVWISGLITLHPPMLEREGPLGLLVSAMASSEFWVNGTRIGANGIPAAAKRDETPGLMDAVIYVPRAILVEGENEIVGRYSGHHGFLTVQNPLHILAIGPYSDPTRRILEAYSISLITLSAFILGFIVFGVSALRGQEQLSSGLISALSLTAAAQLLTEAARGLFAYHYPLHDLRIALIVILLALFGLLLVAYLLQRFSGLPARQQALRLGGVLVAQWIVIALSGGYDSKAGYAFLIACLAGMAWCAVWTWQKKPGAAVYLAILFGFVALLLVFGGQFLDFYFFYAATALLLLLFWQQALALIRARHEREREGQRAAQLEVALAQARQKDAPQHIQLVSSGRVDYIATDTIAQFKGAGDYVEVHYTDGRTALYNGGLSQLEHDLPPSFLRVHRSYIVNTAVVAALERDPTGVGRLLLSDGGEVPVSRRIMPKVRSALDAAPG